MAKIYHKQCKECGQPFDTISNRAMFCNRNHYRICSGCGKSFLVPQDKLSFPIKTCSETCRRISISKTEKSSPKQLIHTCTCEICGKVYQSTSSKSRICPDIHYRKCSYCGKSFKLSHQQALSGTKTCSNECRYKLMHKTTESKYGVSNIMQSDEFKDKVKQTCLEKYGVSCSLQSAQAKEKAKTTYIEHYGVTHPSKSAEVLAKREATCQSRYGVAHVLQSEEIRAKSKQTWVSKYGVDNPSKSKEIVQAFLSDPSKIDAWEQFYIDPKSFILNNFASKPSLLELSEAVGMRDSSVGQIILANNLSDLINHVMSSMEDEVTEFLQSILPEDIEIQHDTRKVITPLELDIYLPQYNLAIECNPTCTHNSTLPGFSENDQPKSTVYHKNKSDRCENQNIFLFHLFGYDWTHKKQIIKSMLRNLVNCNEIKIYARQCEIRSVSGKDAYDFLEQNHRQGGVHSKYRFGLYYNNELVSLMTFSKMRNTIGTGKTDLSDCYELVRFCNKINTSVVGSASKLFKHFIKNYPVNKIRSFSDRAHTRGTLYETLGFQEITRSDANYVWVNLKTDKAYHRINAQKQNIIKFLKDDNIDLTKSENEIMQAHKFVKVYDSGTITWEWNRYIN